jgi:hypothetical protein
MKVDLPTPGVPERPILSACRPAGLSASMRAVASARWSARVLSTSVTARASARLSPARMRSASVSVSVMGVPSSHGAPAPVFDRNRAALSTPAGTPPGG